jgi:hypothetical protein
VALLVAVNGLIIGGFGGVLPSIRERLDISTTHIAIMLFILGLAGIAAMEVAVLAGLSPKTTEHRACRIWPVVTR